MEYFVDTLLKSIPLILLMLVVLSPRLHAQSVTINFDPPSSSWVKRQSGWATSDFWVSQSVSAGGSRTRPRRLTRRTRQLVREPRMRQRGQHTKPLLKKKASEISVRVSGSEITPLANFYCFPEGTDCSVYARLVGYDESGTIIVDSRDVALFNAGSAIGLGAPITRELKVSDPYGRIAGAAVFVGKGTFSHDSGNPGRVQIDQLRVDFVTGTPPAPPPPRPHHRRFRFCSRRLRSVTRTGFQIEGTWSAPAGLLGLCVRINEPVPLQQFCTNNATLTDTTFSLEAYREALDPTGNVINVSIVDLLGRQVTVSRPFSPQPPPPPLVSIWSPSAGVWNATGGTLPTLSGSTWVVGTPRGFCVRITPAASPQPAPAASACNEVARLNANGKFTGIPLDPAKLQPGANDVTVYVYDAWGRMGQASVRGTVPANIRISGVEITQGSQTFAMNAATGAYYGTELARGLRTIVRVFASTPSGGPFPGVNATLEGFVPDMLNGGEKSAGAILLPDNGKQSVTIGPILAPLATRAKPDAAFVFTLPTSWTLQSGLRLRAIVNNPLFTGTVTECTGCAQDNRVDVTQINFQNPLPTMTVSPVEIRWWDTTPAAKDPLPSESVFAELRAMLPLTDGQLVVRPYVGRIDLGNSTPSTTAAANLIDNNGSCTGTCPGNVFGAVSNFEQSNQPGLTIGITTAQLRGLTSPVPFVRFPDQQAIENIAMASTTFNVLPLRLQVAHEVMHQSGFLHASGSCGAQDQLSEAWPPDLSGRLQGIGLDRRTGSGPTAGTYAVIADDAPPGDAYDLMSYCAPRGQSWLSPRYWSRFGKAFTASLPCLSITCQYAGVPSGGRSGYRVMARQESSGAWTIVSVMRSLMPAPQRQERGSVQLIGRDDTGRVVASIATEPVEIADDPGARLIAADLRAEALNSVALVVANRTVASRTASATVPRITTRVPDRR